MHWRLVLALALAASVGGCGGNESEPKVGGAWAAVPVKCSAYFHDDAQYKACLERDRLASVPRAVVSSQIAGRSTL